MKKETMLKSIFLLTLVLFFFAACERVEEDSPYVSEDELTEADDNEYVELEEDLERHSQWQYDIVQFRDHTLAWHPKFVDEELIDLAHNVEIRQVFEERIDALLENVSDLTDFEIKVKLQHAVAGLRDNHFVFTGLILGSMFEMGATQERYPLMFGWFTDGWYLYQSHMAYADALNHRLVAINHMPVDEAFLEFKQFASHENIYDAKDMFAFHLNSPIWLQILGISDEGELIYTFQNDDDSTFDLLVSTTTPWEVVWHRWEKLEDFVDNREGGSLPLFHQNIQEHHWHVFVEEDGILYIRIHVYRHDMELSYPFTKQVFYQAVRETFETYDVQAIVIDARGNPGGYYNHQQLFEFLAEHTTSGMLFYFMDEGSRSGSLMAGAHLYSLGAVLVGQPMGQATEFYYFSGGGSPPWSNRLNYSGYELSVPNSYWSTQEYGINPEDLVFRPHVLIPYTIDDWVQNHDPLYDYVLELLRLIIP